MKKLIHIVLLALMLAGAMSVSAPADTDPYPTIPPMRS